MKKKKTKRKTKIIFHPIYCSQHKEDKMIAEQ